MIAAIVGLIHYGLSKPHEEETRKNIFSGAILLGIITLFATLKMLAIYKRDMCGVIPKLLHQAPPPV